MRRSPVMIFMMYLASSGVARASRPRTIAVFAAGPRARGNLTKRRLHFQTRQDPDRHVREELRLRPLLSLRACDKQPSTRLRLSQLARPQSATSDRPPICSVVSSQAGNGRPERKTADTRGLISRARLQIVRDDARLEQFLRGRRNGFASCGQTLHASLMLARRGSAVARPASA